MNPNIGRALPGMTPERAGKMEKMTACCCNWILRLQRADKVLIGDSGVLNFLISGDALKKREVSNALYRWDRY